MPPARATVAVDLGGVMVVHPVDAVGKWTETRSAFWLYVVAVLASAVAAAAVLLTRSRAALLAAAEIAGGVLLG